MLVLASTCIIVLLMTAAVYDLTTRKIPNLVSVLIAVAALALAVRGASSGINFFCGSALVILGSVILYAYRWLGGGDVKLMAAVSVALSPIDCYRFIIATALFGGVLAVLYLALQKALPLFRFRRGAPMLLRMAAREAWRIRRGPTLPYGVTIAAGGIFVLLNPIPW